jgi:hypothetical protein
MNASARVWLFALCAAAAASYASAEGARCPDPAALGDPITDLKGTLGRYRQVPQHCLEAMFMRCAGEANTHLMDLGEAAVCSVGYEALLDRAFGGNFQALLAWWRSQPMRVAR